MQQIAEGAESFEGSTKKQKTADEGASKQEKSTRRRARKLDSCTQAGGKVKIVVGKVGIGSKQNTHRRPKLRAGTCGAEQNLTRRPVGAGGYKIINEKKKSKKGVSTKKRGCSVGDTTVAIRASVGTLPTNFFHDGQTVLKGCGAGFKRRGQAPILEFELNIGLR